MLKVTSLTKRYKTDDGEVTVLKDIDFSIGKGEFVAIVGPSGCGKTTLLKCVAGLISDYGGTVSFEGRTKGMVFQNFCAFPWLTVRKSIEFALEQQWIGRQERKEISDKWLLLTGLRDFEHYYPKDLSGGMNQRLALAAALSPAPDLVLLDEPFGALDAQTRSLMQELLSNVWPTNRPSVLLVTHDVDEAIYLADRVLVMSARPGEIKSEIKIDLPKERHADLKLSGEFLAIKKHIHYILRSESIKAAQFRASDLNKGSIKIGVHAWAGVTPLYYALDNNYFSKRGVRVDIVPLEKDEDRIRAFRDGEIDLLHLTVDSLGYLNDEEKLDCEIALLMDDSVGADALVAQPGIKEVKDLIGKKIGVETGMFSQFFLEYVLGKSKINLSDVEVVDLRGSEIGSGMLDGQVDAAVLWEPWLSSVLRMTDAHILVSTESERHLIVSVLFVRKAFLVEHHNELKIIREEWQKVIDEINDKKVGLTTRLASYIGLSRNEFEEVLGKMQFIGREDYEFFSKKIKKMMNQTN